MGVSRVGSGVVTMVAAALLAGCTDGPRSASGPLTDGNSYFAQTARQVDVTFTEGMHVVQIPRSVSALRLISLESIGDQGLEIVDWKVADHRRKIGGVQYMAWPPRHRLIPPESIHDGPGYVTQVPPIQHESGLELLIGTRPTTTGYLERRGLRLTYEADGERHEVVYDTGLYVCAQTEPAPRERITDCPAPEEMGREPHAGE